MADESPKETLARLKRASDALDVAQKASKATARDIGRAKRHVAHAEKHMWACNAPVGKREGKRTRRTD